MTQLLAHCFKVSGLHPAWLAGFIDGEACFLVLIIKNSTMTAGVQVQLCLSIAQHVRDRGLLERIALFFGAGTVTSGGVGGTVPQFRLRSFEAIETVLIPLLEAFPLQTQKRLDAEAFLKVYNLMKEQKHLTPEGVAEIQAIKATINRARMAQYKRP